MEEFGAAPSILGVAVGPAPVVARRCPACKERILQHEAAARLSLVEAQKAARSEERRQARLDELPEARWLSFITGEGRVTGEVVSLDEEDWRVPQVRSVRMSALVSTLGLPGPFAHSFYPRANGRRGGGHRRKVKGWCFASAVRTPDPDQPGTNRIRSRGFLLTTDGEVAHFEDDPSDRTRPEAQLFVRNSTAVSTPSPTRLTPTEVLMVRAAFQRWR
ncbi:MAG: hypothetical protein KDB21_04280 [Acidimicrobiales bacterium]|nr:hypothetical protein [Acidimicrobiales bacterium]MCB1040036.1 hypothetical protein [Acidimicrobiales bacterium]